MQKKILFLGAAPTQIPPLRYAREQGHYVITCDYLPDNPGHKLADEWHNVSTTDKEAVLALAQRLKIDAIVAYASDPAAPTAAYVAEKMGLPGNPYQSVLTLARKDLFRAFLKEHGFKVPRSQSFRDRDAARAWLEEIGLPAFIKPVDSSGSKGVTKLSRLEEFNVAFDYAMSFSREKMVVVEQAIERVGYQIDSDIFFLKGEPAFWIWGDQHQDKYCHQFAPIGISFPSVLDESIQAKAIDEVSSVIKKLNFCQGAFNVEFIVDSNDDVWIIEVGPRNGGNLIPEVIRCATGIDLVKYTVDAALGLPCAGLDLKPAKGYWSSYLVHARESGILKDISLTDRVKSKIVEMDIYTRPGDRVEKYMGSNHTLGTMILKFDSMDEMLDMMDNMERDIKVMVDEDS